MNAGIQLLTDPATEIVDTCNFMNSRMKNVAVEAGLRTLLGLENRPQSQFFEILARINERFDVLETCLRSILRDNTVLLETNLNAVRRVRAFAQIQSMQQPWEAVRANCFDPNTLNGLLNIGLKLRDRFPLRKLSDDERSAQVERIDKELGALGSDNSLGSIEKAIVSSLVALKFMLENYHFFGVVAVRRMAEDTYLQAQHGAVNASAFSGKNRKERKERCRKIAIALGVVLSGLIIEAPIMANDWLTAIDELPTRTAPLIDDPKAWVQKKLRYIEPLLLMPPSGSSPGEQSADETVGVSDIGTPSHTDHDTAN